MCRGVDPATPMGAAVAAKVAAIERNPHLSLSRKAGLARRIAKRIAAPSDRALERARCLHELETIISAEAEKEDGAEQWWAHNVFNARHLLEDAQQQQQQQPPQEAPAKKKKR
jgi:hypothetical protein